VLRLSERNSCGHNYLTYGESETKQNKKAKGKKRREKKKIIKGHLDALAQHRKGENLPWRIQLT